MRRTICVVNNQNYSRYLDLDHKKRIVEEYLPKQAVEQLKKFANTHTAERNDESEPPKKKQKLKGRNKQVSESGWIQLFCKATTHEYIF